MLPLGFGIVRRFWAALVVLSGLAAIGFAAVRREVIDLAVAGYSRSSYADAVAASSTPNDFDNLIAPSLTSVSKWPGLLIASLSLGVALAGVWLVTAKEKRARPAAITAGALSTALAAAGVWVTGLIYTETQAVGPTAWIGVCGLLATTSVALDRRWLPPLE